MHEACTERVPRVGDGFKLSKTAVGERCSERLRVHVVTCASIQAGKQMSRHHRRSTKGHGTVKKSPCVANGIVGRELSRQVHNSIDFSCPQCPRRRGLVNIRAYRVKSLFPRNGRAEPTRPVSSWYMRYASRRWSGDKGPLSPRRSWTARAMSAGRSNTPHHIEGDHLPFSTISPTKTLVNPATIWATGMETC